MTSGDVGIIRVWDVERELPTQDIISGSESCITSLVPTSLSIYLLSTVVQFLIYYIQANQAGKGQVLVAGCGDGSVRVFDCRGKYGYVYIFSSSSLIPYLQDNSSFLFTDLS